MVAEVSHIPTTAIGGVSSLRALSAQNDPQALTEAAQQFEALFLQMMLQSMRSAGSSFAEDRDRSYEEMFDREIAVELARKNSLGIADMLLRQMGHDPGAASVPDSGSGTSMTPGQPGVSSVAPSRQQDFTPDSPEEFVEQIWPLARRAAEHLGIDPRAIVAQAALETGWGQNLIRDTGGISANNLFGIKADHRWDGDRVSVRTLEHENGAFAPRMASFRSYETLEAGFADYQAFLTADPRYAQAVGSGNSVRDFSRHLQEAGYATDPDYADKISEIASGRLAELLDSAR